MVITKNHIGNVVFWVGLVVFFAIKSVPHTIKVHQQGVSSAIHHLQTQAQARLSIIKNTQLAKKSGFRSLEVTRLFQYTNDLQYELDPYEFISKNSRLSEYLKEKKSYFSFASAEEDALAAAQHNLDLETLIYNAHADSFNRLISRFPYTFFSKNYGAVPLAKPPSLRGIIVER
jgi:hypothetical protein